MNDIVAELDWRGLVHQTTDPDLGKHLLRGPHVVYCGFDPTADSLHIGHLLGLLNLARFQKAGHKAIALAGGGTGFVGDPSGKSEERNLLTAGQLEANCRAIQAQISRVFKHAGAGEVQLINNAEWLCKLNFIEFLRDIGKHFTVNSMVEKESVRARMEDRAAGISYTEFSYMLLQAYDFFHLHEHHNCRVQVGGSDQFGNITAGCELIRRVYAKRREGGGDPYQSRSEAHGLGLTWPLVTRSDGKKFGKTEAGAIWLSAERTSPYEFYQYWINVPDADVGKSLRYFTELGREEIEDLEKKAAAEPEKRHGQKVLARLVTTLVHGEEECAQAEKAAAALFGSSKDGASLKELGESALLELVKEAPHGTLARARLDGAGAPLVDLMAETTLWPSKGEAKRAIKGGGANLNNEKVSDLAKLVTPADLLHGKYLVLRKGKKDYFLFRAE